MLQISSEEFLWEYQRLFCIEFRVLFVESRTLCFDKMVTMGRCCVCLSLAIQGFFGRIEGCFFDRMGPMSRYWVSRLPTASIQRSRPTKSRRWWVMSRVRMVMSHVAHDSRVTQCDATYQYMRQDSRVCVCDVTHQCMWHGSHICVTW